MDMSENNTTKYFKWQVRLKVGSWEKISGVFNVVFKAKEHDWAFD